MSHESLASRQFRHWNGGDSRLMDDATVTTGANHSGTHRYSCHHRKVPPRVFLQSTPATACMRSTRLGLIDVNAGIYACEGVLARHRQGVLAQSSPSGSAIEELAATQEGSP